MKEKKLVIFDFDGVIADSWNVAYELNVIQRPGTTEEQYAEMFHGNINTTLSKISNAVEINFFEEYEKRLGDITVFTGMKKVLATIAGKYEMIIISSTNSDVIQKFLEREDLAQYFNLILGNDVEKSKVKKMEMVLNKYPIEKDEIVFVTDSVGDLKESEKVGIDSVFVTWGYNKKENVIESGVAFEKMVDSPGELLEVLR